MICNACRLRPAAPDALQCPDCQRGQRAAAIARVREQVTKAVRQRTPKASRLEKVSAGECNAVLRLLGFVVENTSQSRASAISEGFPDSYVRCPRRKVRFFKEDKRLRWGVPRKDGTRSVVRTRPSRVQEAWIAVEEASGGCVIVAACVADLLAGLPRAGVCLTREELEMVERYRDGDPPGEDWRPRIPYADAVRVLREERAKSRSKRRT